MSAGVQNGAEMKIDLNAIVDPYDACVIITPHSSGEEAEARFDLVGLPRVDHLLIGKTPEQALYMTEHLCGICPAAHHLAGVRALDQLVEGSRGSVPECASRSSELVRRLLHYGSHLDQHALKAAPLDRDIAIELRRYGKAAMAAAGSPGHFPDTARPGGVREYPSRAALSELLESATLAYEAAQRACELSRADRDSSAAQQKKQKKALHNLPDFAGANVALCSSVGEPDLYGTHIKAVSHSGVQIFLAPAHQWQKLVTEQEPGAMAPKPYITNLGLPDGYYRVGPAAQLSIGRLATPKAAAEQEIWLAGSRRALHARMIIALHCIEMIERVCQELAVYAESMRSRGDVRDTALSPVRNETENPEYSLRAGTATGLIDSPRGILEHTYTIGEDGAVSDARILTPTAQNEPWLAQLLTAVVNTEDEAVRGRAVEASIREADPCLPISSAPEGTMSVRLERRERT